MFTISDSVHINAPIDRVFLLSTNIELVQQTLGLKPIEGKTSGMIVGGDRLLWAGWKFGFPQMHESLITKYERPNYFQDTMGRGRFQRFQHDHHFTEIGGQTLLHDKVRFTMPYGWAGSLVAQAVMVPHISKLLRRRMHLLRKIAESGEWREYLPDDAL
ncbi:SRPBCC family protein [Granulicella sp. L60]|jgi:ligand-binding SRPBCC domain-containing protein|uniref:SRPBCC family protein n=1 Tax=Granulicella sp. L60 TaxID=1641866 RepID=UPI00131EBA49|nr:SRPBCC family protein [Granulicella sp. L60]